MACKVIVNGSESNLFNTILEAYNGDEELSNTLHSYFSSEEFKNIFGNWEEDYKSDVKSVDYNYSKSISRIEDNGEPKLFKDTKGDYYFIDKDKNKEYVIFNSKSLNSLFSYSEIERLTKVLSYNYTKNNLNIDFENIALTDSNVTIRQSIQDKLQERITAFRASDDYLWEDKADILEEALNNNLDEIVTNVVNYFQRLKINYNENTEDTDLKLIHIEYLYLQE